MTSSQSGESSADELVLNSEDNIPGNYDNDSILNGVASSSDGESLVNLC